MNGHLALFARLSGAPDLVALVDKRIYPDVMPDSPTYPALTYQQVGGSSARGALVDPPLKKARFEVTAWSRSRLEARQIAAQVRIALDRMGRVTAGGVQVDDCFVEDDVDSYDSETRTYATHTSFRLHYRDPA